MMLSRLFLVFLLSGFVIASKPKLKLFSALKQLDFVFPNASVRASTIQSGAFVQNYVFPIDVDVDFQATRTRVFVTTPRFSSGIPITLGYFANDFSIQPYPDYSWHASNGASCDELTSVLRVAIDECNQLWVLDTGKIGDTFTCTPQLLVFDLKTDTLVRRYTFPTSQYNAISLFITPILDVQKVNGKCTDTKVYITDVRGFALIVYDYAANTSWMIKNKLFFPTPAAGTFTIAGISFDLMDGIFGVALSPRSVPDSQRLLYFHSLGSYEENAVSLSSVNNKAIWLQNRFSKPRDFTVIGSRGTQTAAKAMDRNGNLFFVLIDPLALACWDSSTPYTPENIKIIVQDDDTLQFASGLKIIENLKGNEEIWIQTIRYQKLATGTLDPNEVNYRIQTQTINELLNNSNKCNGIPLSSFDN